MNEETQSEYMPNQSGYMPNQSGYIPNQSGYMPNQSDDQKYNMLYRDIHQMMKDVRMIRGIIEISLVLGIIALMLAF